MTLSSQNSHARLQWKPPYYTLNNESDVIHVDPHITQYTVYIFDAYNRSMIHSVNTTKTSLTPINTLPLCPMYQVSAWNAGGEGELSEPAQDSTPRGKYISRQDLSTTFISLSVSCQRYFSSVPLVPLVENIHVTVTAESGALQFHIEVRSR